MPRRRKQEDNLGESSTQDDGQVASGNVNDNHAKALTTTQKHKISGSKTTSTSVKSTVTVKATQKGGKSTEAAVQFNEDDQVIEMQVSSNEFLSDGELNSQDAEVVPADVSLAHSSECSMDEDVDSRSDSDSDISEEVDR